MSNINLNEFQAGQGVSAPSLNENFSLLNSAIDALTINLNSTVSSLNSTTSLKADKNGNSAEAFYVASATEDTQAVNFVQLKEYSQPVGSVIWYAGLSVPSGYLLCNGAAVSRTEYSALFDVIGIKYGVGDSSTTFNLPMLTDNRFIEGATVAGAKKSAGLPNISGTFAGDNSVDMTATTGACYSVKAIGYGFDSGSA